MRDLDLLDEPRAKPAASLEYKPDGTQVRVSVRGFRLFLALTLINTTLLASSVLGPQLFPFLRTSWTQWKADRAKKQADAQAKQALLAARQQCLAHAFPPGAVVYEEGPAEALRLLREGGAGFTRARRSPDGAPRGWVPPVMALPPNYLAAWQARAGGAMRGGTVLFLHERAKPGGDPYLVGVHFDARADFDRLNDTDPKTRAYRTTYRQTKERVVAVTAWPVMPAAEFDPNRANAGVITRQYRLQLPDTFQRPVAQIHGGPGSDRVTPQTDYGNVLRFFGGQIDPADPTRFTIAYQLDGREGELMGRLKDDGVELLPRDGEWKYDNGEVLRLDTPPASQPTVYPPAAVTD
jgi:hypothetical protein